MSQIQETNAQALILPLNVSLYILVFQIKKLEAGRESDSSKMLNHPQVPFSASQDVVLGISLGRWESALTSAFLIVSQLITHLIQSPKGPFPPTRLGLSFCLTLFPSTCWLRSLKGK